MLTATFLLLMSSAGGSRHTRAAPRRAAQKNRPQTALRATGSAKFARYQVAMTGGRWPRVALRWKNSAWLTTAETVAGWNGLAIRKAGSGRCPVRNRSG